MRPGISHEMCFSIRGNSGVWDAYQWRTQEFCSGGGVQQIQLRTERTGDLGGGSPLVRGSGGCCNLVQEISFQIVKFS
jgi:hypothetical protein